MSNQPKKPRRDGQPNSSRKLSNFRSQAWKKIGNSGLIAPLSAAISVVSAITAVWQAQVANDVAMTALADERRARAPDLNAKDISFTPINARNGKSNFLSAKWVNTGQTPTIGLSRASGCGVTPAAATKAMRIASGSASVAPGQEILTGGCMISTEILGRMLATGMPYFIRGQAKYKDQFGKNYSKSVCYGVIIFKGNEPSQVVMQNLSCESFTCIRETCKLKALDSLTDLAEEAANQSRPSQ